MQHSTSPTCIRNMGFLCHIVKEICSAHDIKRPKSEVTVTVTLKQYTTINNPNTNLLRYAQDTIILGRQRQEVKVKVTQKRIHNTLHPKMHPSTEFGIPTFNIKGGMLQTRCEDSGTLNGQCDYFLGA